MPSNEELTRYLKRATVDLHETRRRLRAREQRDAEPIAIVGIGCRYPGGVTSASELWELVAAEGDAISAFPDDRGWDLERLYDADPDSPRTSYARTGGFVTGAGEFDAGFFGIGPREALAMDPQQRMMLELAWEACEHAGVDPTSLRGTLTGVFAGVMDSGYGRTGGAPDDVEGHLGTGTAASVLSGRVAYTLGLLGPALSIDTACSSSLVALHLACQSLRQRECDLALAGGVTVLASPGIFVEFSRQRGLAPDGRCKAFAAAADGTGFSDGAGLLLLERLSDARRAGREVLAVIRGSAVNQDGASNGLTAPHGPSQEAVIRQALANARLSAGEVDAVEAHGTGTTLGDPIEARAVLSTYGEARDRKRPLRLGSLKSNIGHSQAAAGVGGVIKMVMAIRHGLLPRTLHVDQPSPHVDWDGGAVELLTEPAAWEANGHPRRAGVSSFGVSGTNAHVILEEPPAPSAPDAAVAPLQPLLGTAVTPWIVTARSDSALREQAHRLERALAAEPAHAPLAVAWSLADGRARYERRAVVLGRDRADLLDGLRTVAAGGVAPNTRTGTAARARRPVFVFPGQGSQWAGMAVGLLDHAPVFASAAAECQAALAAHVDWSVEDVLRGAAGAPSIDRIEVVQPVLFTVMAGLAQLWRAAGVEPAAVVGHSQGEIVAAHVAGALSLDDAARLVALRSRAISRLAGQGAMVSVALSADEARERLEPLGGRAEIAVVNGPRSVVLACAQDAVTELLAACERDGVSARAIRATIPSHARFVEPLREEVLELLAPIRPTAARVPFYSTVTGGPLDGRALDASYWYRNLREPVRFQDATRALASDGFDAFVEVSAHPLLTPAIESTLEADERADVLVTASLERDGHDAERFAAALAEAFAGGVPVDWAAVLGGSGARVPLPTSVFERSRYWLPPARGAADAGALGLSSPDHPLLGAATVLAADERWLFTGSLSIDEQPWLADHRVFDTVLLPGAALVELALRAGREVGCDELEELTLEAPLLLDDTEIVHVQLAVGPPDSDGRRSIEMHARRLAAEEGEWTRHATGTLVPPTTDSSVRLAEWPPVDAAAVDVADLYEHAADRGYVYGEAFQGLRAAWRRGDELFAEIELDERERSDATRYGLHPALFDAALHGYLLEPAEALRLPFTWSGVRLHAAGAATLRVRLIHDGERLMLDACDEHGEAVLSVAALVSRPVAETALRAAAGPAPLLYSLAWIASGPADRASLTPESVTELRLSLDGAEDADAGDPLMLLREELDRGRTPAAVAVRCTAEAGQDESAERARTAVTRVLALLRGWLAEERLAASRLVLITHAAAAAAEGDEPIDLAAAAVWGLVRTAQAEHPGRFLLVDADEPDGWTSAFALEEPQVALRAHDLLVPRLAPVRQDSLDSVEFSTDGTVLVTGGTSGLGALLARHLATDHGVRRMLLVSRRGPAAEGAEALVAELASHGCEALVAACDVSDRQALERLLQTIPATHPLSGVVHAAGVLDDGIVTTLTTEQLTRTFAPKADAAWHLHELTTDLELSAFVLLSSAAATLGSAGQASYSAANAYLDGLAARRRATGLPGCALAWGLWTEGSAMLSELSAGDVARIERAGIARLSSAEACEAFDAALAFGEPHAAPLKLDTGALRDLARTGTLSPALRGLVRMPARRAQDAGGALAERLQRLPEQSRDAYVLGLVRGEAAAVLGHASAAAIDAERSFKEHGFDSLGAVGLRNRLAAAAGLRLPSTLIFDHPTPRALAAELRRRAEHTTSGAGDVPRLARAATSDAEPIAIVGIGCRYPGGASSADELWELVANGRDAVSPFPDDRGWDLERLFDPDPASHGTSYARSGGFLAGAGEFDAAFFGISPREALAMDPQQRILLELAWEACEHAAVDPTSLRGTLTGVFAGVMDSGYGAVRSGAVAPDVEGYLGTGSAVSVLSGRIAYTLGLVGPAVSVDTACSSSLVALHLACQSLRQGECERALAGGVTVLSSPGVFVEFSRQRGLAPDGRCKAFAAAADGTGFSDGAGLVLLERLSDAERAGRRVLGVIRGSAVNQDGASNGLTAPHGPSQEAVIRQALANARLSAGEVDAVEAHGTGTTLGDPIEAQALLATYGQQRPEGRPLWLGSLKSNIGHSQAAAGVGGVIKMVMAMQHGVLPHTLHIDEPSPHIDWDAGAVELLTEPVEWQANGHPRRAGVSSFGVSGTNAHLIVEEPPRPRAAEADAETPDDDVPALAADDTPLVVTARSEAALRARAEQLHERLAPTGPGAPASPSDVSHALALSRASLARRAVVLGSGGELLSGLRALAAGADAAHVVTGIARSGRRPVFVFPGQGAQWLGMGVELAASVPAFGERLAACQSALAPFVDWPLEEALRGDGTGPSFERVDVVQPASWAVMVALAQTWRSFGVEPAAVIGHSQGEIAAAVVAGALSLEDGARIVALRSRAIREISGMGGMVSLALDAAAAERQIASWDGRVGIAAFNGPSSVVVSGDRDALEQLVERCDRDGVRARVIPVDYASHSSHVERVRGRLAQELAPITPRSADIPFVSSAAGEPLDGTELDAGYWYRSLRDPVRFEQATRALLDDGLDLFIETSPHPVLLPAIAETADADAAAADPDALVTIATLRRGRGGAAQLQRALAEAFVAGIPVDWTTVLAGRGASAVELPPYPFQRTRYWLEPAASADAAALGQIALDHPLLGAAIAVADDGRTLFTGSLSVRRHPWLRDHEILGTVLLPGTAFVELALTAASALGCDLVEELTLERPLPIADDEVRIQVAVGAADDAGRRELAIYATAAGAVGDAAWTRHAVGTCAPAPAQPSATAPPWPPADGRRLDAQALYDRLARWGFAFGPAFRLVRAAWQAGEELHAEVALPEQQTDPSRGFGVHPALLDAALHPAAGTLGDADGSGPEQLPLAFSWRGILRGATAGSVLRVVLSPTAEGTALRACDLSGDQVIAVDAVISRPVDRRALLGANGRAGHDGLQRLRWVPAPPAAGAQPARTEFVGALGEWAPATSPHADLAALGAALEEGAAAPEVVVLDADALLAGAGDDAAAVRQTVERTLTCVQRWLAEPRLGEARLTLLTRGAVAAGDGRPPRLATAAAWGLVRSAQSEHPGRFALLDVDEQERSRHRLTEALALGADEPQLAIRSGELLIPRLERTTGPHAAAALPEGPWVLRLGQQEAAIEPLTEPALPLRPHELRIAVSAIALEGDGRAVAASCAGTVVACGEAVRDVALGARVTAPVAGAVGSEYVIDASAAKLSKMTASPLAAIGGADGAAPVWDVRELERALVVLRRDGGRILLTVPRPLAAQGTALITGGTGGLGAALARHLATARAVARLVLTSRRGLAADGAAELAAELREQGCEVEIAACDVADRGQLEQLLAAIPAERPLTAVVHTAGVVDDGLVESLEPDQLARVLAPKIDGAQHLDELTREHDLAAFVLYSSLASVFGGPGQGGYAAGNAYLDALAEARRSRCLAGQSLQWGLWEERRGMAGVLGDADRARVARVGMAPFSIATGLELFDHAQLSGVPVLVASPIDPAALRTAADSGLIPPIMRALAPAIDSGARGGGSLVTRLAETPREERAGVVLDVVRAQAAAVLGHDRPAAVPVDRSFRDLGFDSLAAVELRNRLGRVAGLRLPATLVFDRPTIEAVAAHVFEQLVEEPLVRTPLEEAIERLEHALAAVPPAGDEREEAVAQLLPLSTRLRRVVAGDGRENPGPALEGDDLAEASDDELFQMIDQELGA